VSGPGFIWKPSPELIDRANVTRLRRALGAADYHELHRISVEEPDRFWPAVVADLGLEFSQRWDTVVDSSRGPEWSTWFNGGRLNLARICVHRWASDEEALVGLYEDGTRESITWSEMSRQVTQLAEYLVELEREPADLACDAIDLIERARTNRDAHPRRRELAGDVRADPAAAAGHERHSVKLSGRHARDLLRRLAEHVGDRVRHPLLAGQSNASSCYRSGR